MRKFRTVLARSTTITAALVVTATSAGPAMASGHSILREEFDGTLPSTDLVNPSPVIAGVGPGGAPWGPEGDGAISDRITGIDDCDDPIVLVRNATNPAGLGSYFAVAADD